MRGSTAIAAAAAALAVAPGAAPAAVSVETTKRCWAEGDDITVRGAGFTPGGPVRLSLERARGGEVLETTDAPRAEPDGVPPEGPDGTLDGGYTVAKETGWFGPTQTRFEMTLRLVDQTRRASGTPPESPDVTATTSFIFSRWNVGIRTVGRRIHPRRPVTISAVGYTNAIGRSLYAHWLRNGRRVHTRRLGVLRGPCGDRRVRLRRGFPFRPRRGSYTVSFNSSRRNARAPDSIIHRAARVR